jgi:GTPase SAR1 family protein
MASNFQLPESSATIPTSEGGDGLNAVHLLVVGLTGAGKSTFISRATGDTSIETGEGLATGTLILHAQQGPKLTHTSHPGRARVRFVSSGNRSSPHRHTWIRR